uniref:LITAF domain-containing protein n=1 Tax=Anopheles atroparvus TaxID=41427 RepID=A0A182JJS4_ANOAO
MSLIATCVFCQEKLPFCSSNTGVLVHHLRDKHLQEVSGDNFVLKIPTSNAMTQKDVVGTGQKKPISTATSNTSDNSKRRIAGLEGQITPAKSPLQRRRKIIYKTTEWRPAGFRVHCHACNGRFFPTVRMATARVTHSSFVAACVLACWPFCFLPCLFNRPTKHHLHCANCNAYLGLYDAQRDCLNEQSRLQTNTAPV